MQTLPNVHSSSQVPLDEVMCDVKRELQPQGLKLKRKQRIQQMGKARFFMVW